MSQTILYYPKINISDGPWLRSALLYWDNISSIVPYSSYDDLTADLSFLQSCGIYKPVYPQDLFYSEYAEAFSKEVMKRINKYENKKMKFPTSYSRIHKEKIYAPQLSEMIHYKKLPSSILEIFQSRSYIHNHNDEWFEIDSKISQIYMRTLAEFEIKASPQDIVLGTDRISKVNEIYWYGNKHQKSSQCYKIDIIKCLPTPSMETSFEEILDFKEKYKNELAIFKKTLREFEEKIHKSESIEEVKFHEEAFIENWQKCNAANSKIFNSSNLSFFLGSICSIVAIPFVNEIIRSNAGDGLSSVIQNGSAMLNFSTRFLNHFGKTNPNNTDNAFAYILKGQNDGIISKY